MSIKSPLSRQFGSRFDSVFDVVKSNPVYDKVSRIPTLDLDFAKTKNLYDGRSTKNLIDFVRDTAPNSSTYVGADRLIKRSVTNLMLQSEDFSTSWSLTNATIDTNVIAAPDGTNTADKIVEDTSESSVHRITQGATVVTGSEYTYSVYAKAAERSYFSIYIFHASGEISRTFYDLTDGSILSTTGAGTRHSPISAGNGWYRFAVSDVNDTDTGSIFNIEINNTASNNSYTGDGTSGIYLWGAQLEEASTVGEYVKTTATKSGAPRFDHNPTTGESLGLLVEESRQNLFSGSQDFSNTYWNSSNSTRTNNSGTAPDNTTTACLVTGLGESYGGIVRRYYPSFAASTTYTLSCFAKAGTMDRIGLRIGIDCRSNDNYCYFNLSNGTATAITPSAGTVVSVSAVAFPNGWYRCVLTYTTSASQDANDFVDIALTTATGSHNYSGAGNAFIWGAQLEEGALFPTSYIPTEGAAVTRGADVASISGTNFSDWYNPSEFSLFANFKIDAPQQSFNTFVTIDDGTSSSKITFYRGNLDSRIRLFSTNLGTITGTSNVESGLDVINKSAYAIAPNNTSIFLNGNLEVTDSVTSNPIVSGSNTIRFGCDAGNGATPNTGRFILSQLTYWDARVANEKLQSVTS